MNTKRIRANRISCRIATLLFILAASVALVTPALAAKKPPPARPININVANIKELEELPGVGQATAKAIIQFRTKSGPFKRPEDLLAIRGISQAKFEKMRPYVTIGSRTNVPRTNTPPTKVTSAKKSP